MTEPTLVLKNTRACVRGRLLPGCDVGCRGGRIVSVGKDGTSQGPATRVIDCAGAYALPGFIDLHLHGIDGRDSREGELSAIEQIAVKLPEFGTTSFLAAITVLSDENLHACVAAIRAIMAAGSRARANVLGVHLEGPFINPRYCGGVFAGGLCAPSAAEASRYLRACGDILRIVTVAPELAGCSGAIEVMREHGVVVSLGHSGASCEQALAAMALGCNHVTHLFNGMLPITAREPGLAGAALAQDDCSVEIIADGHHVASTNVIMSLRTKPRQQVCLVSDACRATGTDVRRFANPGGFAVEVRDGRTWGPGGRLVGSVLTLDQALRNVIDWTGMSLEDAAALVSANPAKRLGLYPQKGEITVGSDADIVVLDSTYRPSLTVVGGEVAFQA